MDPICANIYDLFETLARDVLGKLHEMQMDGRVGVRKVPHIVIQRPGGLTLPSEYLPDWHLPMYGVLSELEETPEFGEFKNSVEKDAELGTRMTSMIGTKSQRQRMRPSDFFRILVTKLVGGDTVTLDVTDDQLVNVWNTTVRSLLATKVTVRYWSILENVEIPVGHREVLESVYLRGLSDEEVQHLWDDNRLVQEYYPFYGHYHSSILNVQTLIETVVEEEVIVGDHEIEPTSALSSFERAQSAFETILTTLRLLRSEPIIMTPVVADTLNLWGGTVAYGTRTPMLKPWGGRCKLNDADLDELDALLRVVNHPNSRQRRSVTVCLRRIGFAGTRTSVEDRLLDIMMALEALVLTGTGKAEYRGELQFRLAIRLARFLGEDSEDMQDKFKLVRDAYRLRSKVIHGDELGPDDEDVIKAIEELTKAATRKYLFALSKGERVDWTALLFQDGGR